MQITPSSLPVPQKLFLVFCISYSILLPVLGSCYNGPNCQLLCIHSSLPISYLSFLSCYSSLCMWLPILCSLLSFSTLFWGSWPSSSSSHQCEVSRLLHDSNILLSSRWHFRCSQASSAFKTLDPLFCHPLISPKFKLRVYSWILQCILLHGSESQVYSPSQLSKIDSLHYKALSQIFQVNSPYYHPGLQPTDSPCSTTSSLFLTPSFLPVFPLPCESLTLVSSALATSFVIPPHPNSIFVSILPCLFAPSLLLFDEAPQVRIGQNLPWLNPLIGFMTSITHPQFRLPSFDL